VRTAKVIYTGQLALANVGARGRNREIPQEYIDRLDPNGVHVVGITLPHEHVNGVRVEPHMRVQVYAKMADAAPEDKPTELWLDMDLDDYNRLREIVKDPTTGEWRDKNAMDDVTGPDTGHRGRAQDGVA
jgi:hypothetical protein